MIVQNNTSIADLFKFKVLIAERLPMESQKKNLLNLAAGNRAQHIQSYLSNHV